HVPVRVGGPSRGPGETQEAGGRPPDRSAWARSNGGQKRFPSGAPTAAPCPSPPVIPCERLGLGPALSPRYDVGFPGGRLPADSLQHARILGAARPRCAPVDRVLDAGPRSGCGTGIARWTPGGRSCRALEGQSYARGDRVGVVALTPRVHAVEALGRVEPGTGEEITTLQIEGGARGEPPRQPELQLGTEIVGIALHPALIVHGRTVREGLLGSEDDRRVRVDLLRRPGRARGPRIREMRREDVRRPEAKRGPTEAVVSDEVRHALAGTTATVEIVDTA